MNKLHKLLFLMFLFSGIINANAQDITISSVDLVNLKNEITLLKDSLVGLKKIVSEKDSIIESRERTLSELTSLVDSLSSALDDAKNNLKKNESIIADFQSKEGYLNNQMQTMQETSDRNTAKLANGRLYFRYSDKLVLPSIQSLLELKTEKVKKDFEQALQLLQNYKAYSEDVKSTFIALQTINRDEWRSKHQAEEYKNKCLSILKQSNYYKNVYSKRSANSWSIPYLDNLIDVAKLIISRHNPVEYDFANFTPLIEML